MRAELNISVAHRNGVTFLQEAYYTPPFKIADITEDKKQKTLDLMWMCSSPGVLDEDNYTIDVSIQDNCILHLHTQSYQRLFSMKKGAVQKMNILVGRDSGFIFLPHPSVPHESSLFSSTNRIYLSEKATLIWGEIITCGRKLNGEIFRFSRYHNRTEIFINETLAIKENLLLEPKSIDTGAIGQMEGYTHQGSLIFIHDTDSHVRPVEDIRQMLQGYENFLWGVSACHTNGCIVRILGQKAEEIFECMKMIGSCLQKKYLQIPNYAE